MSSIQITQIIPAHSWYAHFEDGTTTPIIAWGLQHRARVAEIIPISVHEDGSNYNPTETKGFTKLAMRQQGLKEQLQPPAPPSKRVDGDEPNNGARPSKA
jgi:hypothetical protein